MWGGGGVSLFPPFFMVPKIMLTSGCPTLQRSAHVLFYLSVSRFALPIVCYTQCFQSPCFPLSPHFKKVSELRFLSWMPRGYFYFAESVCLIILLFSHLYQLPAKREHTTSNHFQIVNKAVKEDSSLPWTLCHQLDAYPQMGSVAIYHYPMVFQSVFNQWGWVLIQANFQLSFQGNFLETSCFSEAVFSLAALLAAQLGAQKPARPFIWL